MKIRGELLRIQSHPFDGAGQRLEPEELPAEKLLITDAPVMGQLDGLQHGSIPASVNVQGTVSQFANQLRTMCAQCRHFNANAWVKAKAKLEGSKEGVQALNNIRWALMQEGLGPAAGQHATAEDELDLEHALSFMGICRALTEWKKDDVLVHPMGGCPPEVCSDANPTGYFENVNSLEAQRAGDSAYDQVMRRAQNKLP